MIGLITLPVRPRVRLYAADYKGPGNSIACDVQLAEMLIAKNISLTVAQFEDPDTQLKTLLKG